MSSPVRLRPEVAHRLRVVSRVLGEPQTAIASRAVEAEIKRMLATGGDEVRAWIQYLLAKEEENTP